MAEDSFVQVNGGSVAFIGHDAVHLYRAMVLASALKLYAKTKMLPTRGVSARAMLLHATAYTGKTYKRGEAMKAAEDVRVWVATMKAAMPVVEG
jgi:hypothetical protein